MNLLITGSDGYIGSVTATTIEDGVHPTRAGNKALTRAILEQSAAEGCFA